MSAMHHIPSLFVRDDPFCVNGSISVNILVYNILGCGSLVLIDVGPSEYSEVI